MRLIEPASSASRDQAPGFHTKSFSAQSAQQPSLDPSSDAAAQAPRQQRSLTAIQNVTVVNRLPSGAPGSTLPQKLPAPKEEASRIEAALSYALQAADLYVRQGFTVREDYWGGALKPGTTKRIAHQLFRGNEYWFWLGVDPTDASPEVHIYNVAGELEESEHWQRPAMAAARIVPKKTGTYYLLIDIGRGHPGATANKQANSVVHWALAYGFR
jgi:hypothetical protein